MLPQSRVLRGQTASILVGRLRQFACAATDRRLLTCHLYGLRCMSSLPHDDFDDTSGRRESSSKEKLEQKDPWANKKGRLWSDPWDLDEFFQTSYNKLEDLPDWAPEFVSRISQERVKLHPDGIPTLESMAQLDLPPPAVPNPGLGQTKAYALHRKRKLHKYIAQRVRELAAPKIAEVQALSDWNDKQDAVDQLYEEIEFQLKESEVILGKHPSLGVWVEKALEEYLRSMNTPEKAPEESAETAHPIFMDCFNEGDPSDDIVPKIFHPLKPVREVTGRMVEEWELAAHRKTKRIMLRQCTKQIATALVANERSRVFVSGRQGVGKTAALMAIVASARKSGWIVLYLPDGDQLHKNGYYVEPNSKRTDIYDLPVLTQRACQHLLDSHSIDLEGCPPVDHDAIAHYFTDDQMERFRGPQTPLIEILKIGAEKASYAGPCYSVAVDVLMGQKEKPFLLVLDDFNCFFEPGHYFHKDYDPNVKFPVPYGQISLFKPILDVMALSNLPEDKQEHPALLKRGAVLVATTESHAVARKVTDALVERVRTLASVDGSLVPLVFCDVPRLTELETEHMLAHYEAIGLGKLRLDQGATVMDRNEVGYLRIVSGGIPQKLMDACILD